jgi:hypothetical protein
MPGPSLMLSGRDAAAVDVSDACPKSPPGSFERPPASGTSASRTATAAAAPPLAPPQPSPDGEPAPVSPVGRLMST